MLVPQFGFFVVVCLVWGLTFILEHRQDIYGEALSLYVPCFW